MARSRKRHPVVTCSSHYWKKVSARRHRKGVKAAMLSGRELPFPRQLTNQYDVCDWRFWPWTKEQEITFKRK
jgi:hypothetical protein